MANNNSAKKLFSNSIIYTICGVLQKCFSFFLLPLYTVYLTKTDYGITSLVSSFVTTMSFIVAFSLFSAVLRFYVDLKSDPKKLKRFYGTVIITVYICCIIWCVILTICKELLSKYIFSDIPYYPIIFLALVTLIFTCQMRLYETMLKSQQKALKVSIINICYFLVSVGLNIIFVVSLKLGAVGVVVANVISLILYTIVFLIDIIKNKLVVFCLDWGLLKSALKYSIPIIPHNLSTQIALLVSKVLIGGKTSLADLGLYSVASQFGNIADIIQQYIDQAYGPWLYEKLNDKENFRKTELRKIVNFLISVIGLFFIGISLFAQDYIVLFVDHQYIEAWKYVPLIVLVFAIKTMYYFYVEVLFYNKEASRKLFFATVTGSLVNVFFSFYMIPKWGVFGSIGADALAMVVRVGIVYFISLKYDDIGLKLMDFVKNLLLVVLFIAVGLSLSIIRYPDSFNFLNFSFKVAIVLVYIGLLYLRFKPQFNNAVQTAMKYLKKGKNNG